MSILVIGRNSGESFVIGDDITVTVKDCKNGRCRVIINAPSDVAINRMELLEGKSNAGTRQNDQSKGPATVGLPVAPLVKGY